MPLTAGIAKPLAEVNAGCLKLNGDAADKLAPSPGNIDAAAAATAAFDTDGMLLVGRLAELPEPADDGLGDSEGLPIEMEDGTVVDIGVDNAPLLLPDIELPPILGEGETLCPDLEPGD